MENNDSPELIEAKMQETRNALTDKVSTLESQVFGTIQSAQSVVKDTVDSVKDTVETMKTAMQDTVSSVKDSVQESVTSVTDSVKSTFDVTCHVRNNPWAMLGGAVATGLVTGLVVFRNRETHYDSYRDEPKSFRPLAAPVVAATPAVPSAPTWLDGLLEKAGQEIRKVGEAALAQASESLMRSVHQTIPKLVGEVEGRLGLTDTSATEGRAEGPNGHHFG